MQEFFIETYYIPEDERPTVKSITVKIQIPHQCAICNNKLIIARIGDENRSGVFGQACEHFAQYPQVWENRLDKFVAINKVIDPIDDGCKCKWCSEWVPMAAPNQLDNSFKCYGCRSREY